jgi:hypothetical protein
MIANPKSTKDASPESQGPENAETPQFFFPMAFATMFHKGFERVADLQKTALDLYAHQAEDAVNTWKKAFQTVAPSAPSAPVASIADMAGQSVCRLAEMQKGVVDLMVKQSAAGVEAFKQRGAAASKTVGGVATLVNDAVDCSVATQKLTLDFAAQQNKIVMDAIKQQPGVPGTPVSAAADAIKRGMDAAIENQKQLLDMAAKPLKTEKAEA